MAIIKNIKGRLIDVEALISSTVSFFRDKLHIELKEKEYIKMATTTAYFMAKQNFLPEFTPFNCSLKKLYGDDFFDNKPNETPDFDGCVLLRNTEVYYGDTDGDTPCIGRYPFIAQDPVKMIEKLLGDKKYENVGKASNLATKRLNCTPTQLKEAIQRYNHNITIDLWKNDDGTTTAIYQQMKPMK